METRSITCTPSQLLNQVTVEKFFELIERLIFIISCVCVWNIFFFSSLCTVIPSQLNCAGNQLSFIICLQLVAVCLITLNVLYTLSGKTKNTNCIIQFKCSTISNPIQINWHVSKRHTHYTPQQKKNNNNNISGCMIWYKMLDIRNWQLFLAINSINSSDRGQIYCAFIDRK